VRRDLDELRAFLGDRARPFDRSIEGGEPVRELVHPRWLGGEQAQELIEIEARFEPGLVQPGRCLGELGDQLVPPARGLGEQRMLLGKHALGLARTRSLDASSATSATHAAATRSLGRGRDCELAGGRRRDRARHPRQPLARRPTPHGSPHALQAAARTSPGQRSIVRATLPRAQQLQAPCHSPAKRSAQPRDP
jgi:hypothetical protein